MMPRKAIRQRLAVLLLLLCCALAGLQGESVAYHNLASVHLGFALASVASAQFPLVLDAPGRAELSAAAQWLRASTAAGATDASSACLQLRLHSFRMAWLEADAIERTSLCRDPTLYGRPTLGLVLRGLRQYAAGDEAKARLSLRDALVTGSTLLSPSLEPWLTLLRTAEGANSLAEISRFAVGPANEGKVGSPDPSIGIEWALVEYDLSEAAVREAVPTSIVLYWRALSPSARPGQGWRRAGDLWRQDVESINLVPDGGFEWAADGAPAWNLPGSSARIVLRERNGEQTRILSVEPRAPERSVIVSSPVMPVLSRCLLLVGAWVRSESEARPAVSVVWAGVEDRPERRAFDDLVLGDLRSGWRHISAVVKPLPDAGGVSLYFSNWSQAWEGGAAFLADDAFLLPIPSPSEPAACKLAEGFG